MCLTLSRVAVLLVYGWQMCLEIQVQMALLQKPQALSLIYESQNKGKTILFLKDQEKTCQLFPGGQTKSQDNKVVENRAVHIVKYSVEREVEVKC